MYRIRTSVNDLIACLCSDRLNGSRRGERASREVFGNLDRTMLAASLPSGRVPVKSCAETMRATHKGIVSRIIQPSHSPSEVF